MKGNTDRRSLVLRLALALFACGGAVFVSPTLVRGSVLTDGEVTCTSTCTGGSCTGNKPYCVCSCSWFGRPICSCTSAPEEQTPTSPTTTPTT